MGGDYSRDMAAKYGGAATDYVFPYTINFVPDSKPIVVVWRKDENSEYEMLGNYVLMEEKKANFANGMRSIYDKISTDGTVDPFDFMAGTKGDRLWDNEGCMQMENLRNHQLTFFRGDNQWQSEEERRLAYEMIYPDEEDVIEDYESGKSDMTVNDYWNQFYEEVVHPIASTYGNQQAFNNIIFQKLDKWYLAAYYCLVLR